MGFGRAGCWWWSNFRGSSMDIASRMSTVAWLRRSMASKSSKGRDDCTIS